MFSQLSEDSKNKRFEFYNNISSCGLFLTNPATSFWRLFRKNPNNKLTSAFTFTDVDIKELKTCYEEDQDINFRTLSFKIKEIDQKLELMLSSRVSEVMKLNEQLNYLKLFVDDNQNEVLQYICKYSKLTISDLVERYSSISDKSEKNRIDKFKNGSTNNLQLRLDAKDLFLLAKCMKEQPNIVAKGVFVINFFFESYIRGCNEAFYELVEIADTENKELVKFDGSQEQEEKWFLKLLAQHVLGIIFGCGLRLTKKYKSMALDIFNNITDIYSKLKSKNDEVICQIPQSVICSLLCKNSFEISEDDIERLKQAGINESNDWCIYKLLEIQEINNIEYLTPHQCYLSHGRLREKEHVLYLMNQKEICSYEVAAMRGYADAFAKLSIYYYQNQNDELAKILTNIKNELVYFTNGANPLLQANQFPTKKDFEEQLTYWPLSPIILSAIPSELDGCTAQTIDKLITEFEMIRSILIIYPVVEKLSLEWKMLKRLLNACEDLSAISKILEEWKNQATLLGSLNLTDSNQIIEFVINSKDICDSVKNLLKEFSNFEESTLPQEIISVPLTNVSSQHLCKSHNDQKLMFICRQCEEEPLLCPLCLYLFHYGHSVEVIQQIIPKEKKSIEASINVLESKEQALVEDLKYFEEMTLKIEQQFENENQKLDDTVNKIKMELDKKKDFIKQQLIKLHNERINKLSVEKEKIKEDIQFIRKEVRNCDIEKLVDEIEIIEKRKELKLKEEQLKYISNTTSTAPKIYHDFNQFQIIIASDEDKWLERSIGVLSDKIIDPTKCILSNEGKPKIFKDKLEWILQLKDIQNNNIEKGGYLVKVMWEQNTCQVNDLNNGTYKITIDQYPILQLKSILNLKLPIQIEKEIITINIPNITNRTIIDLSLNENWGVPFLYKGEDLSGYNFISKNFSGFDFSNTNLSNTNFTNANLSDSNLTNANFTKANLSNSNLSNTNLTNTILSYSDLRNTKLDGVKSFTGISLTNCKVDCNTSMSFEMWSSLITQNSLNKEIIMEAIKQNQKLINYASSQIRNDKSFMDDLIAVHSTLYPPLCKLKDGVETKLKKKFIVGETLQLVIMLKNKGGNLVGGCSKYLHCMLKDKNNNKINAQPAKITENTSVTGEYNVEIIIPNIKNEFELCVLIGSEDLNSSLQNSPFSISILDWTWDSVPFVLSQSSYYSDSNCMNTVEGLQNDSKVGSGTQSETNAWVQASFFTPKTVQTIHLGPHGWGSSYLNGCLLQYSNDGTNWTTFITLPNNIETITSYQVGITAKYWRLYRTSGYVAVGTMRFYEISKPLLSEQGIIRQWVKNVVSFSSEYGGSWTAKNLIGPSKIYPQYGDIGGAWTHPSGRKTDEYLELEYEHECVIEEIEIYETYNPGAIVKITAISADKSRKTVLYQGISEVGNLPAQSRIFKPKLMQDLNTYKYIKLDMDCRKVPSYFEIDAVCLIGSSKPFLPYTLSQSSKYSSCANTYESLQDHSIMCGVGTNSEANPWIQATFPSSKIITSVSVKPMSANAPGGWGAGHLNGAILQYSQDNVNWTNVVTLSGHDEASNALKSYPVNSISARYWRIYKPSGYLGVGMLKFCGK